MLTFMKNRSVEAGVKFPQDFRLIDITLNNVFDYDSKEMNFWKKAPSSFGELIKWPMGIDGVVSPHDLPDSVRKSMCKTGITAIDGLNKKAQQIKDMLSSP